MNSKSEAMRLKKAYLLYRAIALFLSLMPRKLSIYLAESVSMRLADRSPAQFATVKNNLQAVLSQKNQEELQKAVYQAYKDYGRYWAEVAGLTSRSIAALEKYWSIEGEQFLAEALETNGKVILALPHLGSWEIGALWFARQGWQVTTVAEAIQPPSLFEWFKQKREKLGLRIIPLSPDASPSLAKVLKNKGMVALVADRDISGGGIEVEFFGRRAKLPGGPALLALHNDATLLPCAVYQHPNGKAHGVILPPIDTKRYAGIKQDVIRVTQELACNFETLIQKAPSQWHVFQPIFLEESPAADSGGNGLQESAIDV
ncbi:MAG: phosphatidylinositol mannoside acyltransferase [Firmicutes bacterium]|nr:phosphatidylinositol mannoside acyltransferase [Bacillota bacterium]